MSREDLTRRVAAALGVASFALFVALNIAFVVKEGVCCADDGFVATTAKNLAWGFGYSTSLGFDRPDYVLERFDASVTTGPTLVLPVSAAIRILGNRHWVPGAVHVALWSVLLFATWRALGSPGTRSRTAMVGSVFLLVAYAVSPHHLEQWYAMLGEVPAALALLLGLVVWAGDPGSGRRCLVAAVLWALAALTKILALLYVATFLAAAVSIGLSCDRDRQRRWRPLALLVLGLLLPILSFEVWKVASIGREEYLSQVRAFGDLLSTFGTSGTGPSAADTTARLILFYRRFGVSLPGLLVLSIFGGSMAWRSGSSMFKRLYLVLLAGVVVHASYWLVLSFGWPRYFFVGVVLLSALVALPYLALEGRGPVMLYSGVLALTLVGAIGRVQEPISVLGSRWFAPSSTRSSQESVVRFLDAHLDRRPFVGQWWASVADLEYLSKGVLNFRAYEGLTPEELSRGALVVTNSRFDDMRAQSFSSVVAACGEPVFAAPPYAVRDCGRRNMTPAAQTSPHESR
jgi:hypothetical protein